MPTDGRTVTDDAVERDDWPGDAARRFRLVPPAITPVGVRDLLAGLRAHRRGEGRREFRESLRSFLDADTAATYTSYRRALGACFLELRDAAEADGLDRVLVPAFASSDFADAAEGVGLTVERYDIDADSLAVRPETLTGRLDDALALVAVNVLGYSSRMDALERLCAETDTVLVEALGYALGSAYRGRRLGTFGDVVVVNFQQGKPIPVGGGMVLSHEQSVSVSDDDRPDVSPNLAALSGYAVCGRPRLYYLYSELTDRLSIHDGIEERATTHPGSKLDVEYGRPFARMSNFQCAVGDNVFDRLDEYRQHRERTARQYRRELADCPGIDLLDPVAGLSDHQYVRFPVLADPALRPEIRDALAETGVQSTTLYDWPVLDESAFPAAARVQRRILTLPTHPYVDERDRQRIVETVRETVTDHRRRE